MWDAGAGQSGTSLCGCMFLYVFRCVAGCVFVRVRAKKGVGAHHSCCICQCHLCLRDLTARVCFCVCGIRRVCVVCVLKTGVCCLSGRYGTISEVISSRCIRSIVWSFLRKRESFPIGSASRSESMHG